MKYRLAVARVLSLAFFVLVASFGCNSVLGNEEGTARLEVAAADGSTPQNGDASAGVEAGATCDTTQGKKVCFGLCVPTNDPNTGCGASSCAACDPKNVSGDAVCQGVGDTGFACAFKDKECKPGFESCDDDKTNGCETSLGSKTSCGSCSNRCGSKEFCAADGRGGYGCASQCPDNTQDCSGACVDLQTSTENCGKCGNKCARASASATCQKGTCVYTCAPGTHECNGACVSVLDPLYCGTSCTACPKPPNTESTCNRGTCGVTCTSGWTDCDGDPTNGCGTKGTTCPKDCLFKVGCPILQTF